MHYFVRFWAVVLSLVVSVAALGYLSVTFVLPRAPGIPSSPTLQLAAAVVAVAALGVVVWSSATFGDVVSENPR